MEFISEVLASGDISHGKYNTLFEQTMCRFLGVSYGVATSSGYAALHSAIQCLGITGDIIVPSFTFSASVNAIIRAGANPVFADVDYCTRNITAAKIAEALTPNTKAVMVVHFGGQVCEMGPIEQLIRDRNLYLIEDCAQTLGARYCGRMAGAFGVGCFSFFATKHITTGEGGFVSTSDSVLREAMQRFNSHGIARNREMPWYRDALVAGMNFRMSNLDAAIGYAQLGRLKQMNARRQRIATDYNSRLNRVDGVELPVVARGCEHTYQMYTICVEPLVRDRLVSMLRDMGVMASVHFAPAVHQQTCYRGLAGNIVLPATEKLSRSILSLPMYPDMSDEEVDQVCHSVQVCLTRATRTSD